MTIAQTFAVGLIAALVVARHLLRLIAVILGAPAAMRALGAGVRRSELQD